MSVLRSELRIHARSTWAWVVGVVLLVAMIAAFYPAVRNLPSLDSLYADLPPAVQALLGGSDLVSPSGYLRTQLLAFFLPVVLLILGMGRGAAALAGEEEDRTLDLLLAQPVSRWRLYTIKSVALTWWLALLSLATFATLAALDHVTGLDIGWGDLAAVSTQMGLMCLTAALITMALSAATGRRMVGIAAVGAYLFIGYVVHGLSDVVSWLHPVDAISLWRWYLGNDPITGGLDPVAITVLAAGAAAAITLGAWAFDRRDLHA